jgi:hypothetical protein
MFQLQLASNYQLQSDSKFGYDIVRTRKKNNS